MSTPANNHVQRTAYIGVGSNLGERDTNIRDAIEALTNHPAFEFVKAARAIMTKAVDCPTGSPDFLNTVVALNTYLEPRALVDELLNIERTMGRNRLDGRNLPRSIDLDLLLLGELICHDPKALVPHPRMYERDFVLRPLVEIAPYAVHPIMDLTAAQLFASCPDNTTPAAV